MENAMKRLLFSLVCILVLISAAFASGDDACQRLSTLGDFAGAAKACAAALASGGTARDALALAGAHRDLSPTFWPLIWIMRRPGSWTRRWPVTRAMPLSWS